MNEAGLRASPFTADAGSACKIIVEAGADGFHRRGRAEMACHLRPGVDAGEQEVETLKGVGFAIELKLASLVAQFE